MKTFSSNSNNFKMTLACYDYPQDPNVEGVVYTAGQTMLRFERLDQQVLTGFAVYITLVPSQTLSYYTDPNGVLEIPLKNLVNANYPDGVINISVDMFDVSDLSVLDHIDKGFRILEGISELEANIPIKEMKGVFGLIMPPTIMPPNVIFNPYYTHNTPAIGIIVESGIQNQGIGYVWKEYIGGVGTTITPSGGRTNQIEVAAASDTLELTDGVNTQRWRLERSDSCADMLCVRWKSLTGATRQHYFPVMSYNIGTDNIVSLVTVGDGYETLKNHNNGVTCRITGLTPYGYWYYADLLRASEVYAVLEPSINPWVPIAQEAAYVETDSASVNPDANGFLTFEFTVKLKHYGTF